MPTLRERDKNLVENWYVACLSTELGKSKPIRRIIYDSPLVLFRSLEGKAVCLPDRCLHRHAQLSKGKVFDGKIGCPYHGWVYDSQGYVVEVPSEKAARPCEKDGLRLSPKVAVEQDGCVWVWMGEENPKDNSPPFRFPHFEDSKWGQYFMTTDFDNEVTHLAENFMDVPHTVFVHRGWFRTMAKKKVDIDVETAEGSVLVTYNQSMDSIGFTGRILNPKNEPMIHTDRFILPNLTRVDYNFGSSNSFIIISQCTPVSTLKSRVYTRIIYRLGAFTGILKPFFKFYTRQVIEQDVKIMAIQGENFKIDFETDFKATEADVVHAAIEKLRHLAAHGALTSAYSEKRNERAEIWI